MFSLKFEAYVTGATKTVRREYDTLVFSASKRVIALMNFFVRTYFIHRSVENSNEIYENCDYTKRTLLLRTF